MKPESKIFLFLLGFIVIQSAVLPAAAAGNRDSGLSRLPIADSNNFCFAVIGDRQGQAREGVFEAIIEKLNLLRPEFAISIGDSIEGYTSDVGRINEQWDEFDAVTRTLKMPLLKTVGNHDMTNETMAAVYRQRYGLPYFHVIYKNTLFLFVSTEDPVSKEPNETKAKLDKVRSDTYVPCGEDAELVAAKKRLEESGYVDVQGIKDYEQKSRDFRGAQISDEQVQYFKNVLEKNKDVRWTFVVMHKRAYLETNPPRNWLEIENILSGHSYTVFSGHEHRYEYAQRNGHDYIGMATAGGGQKYPPNASNGIYDNILLVTMSEQGPVLVNILAEGIFDKGETKKAKVLFDSTL